MPIVRIDCRLENKNNNVFSPTPIQSDGQLAELTKRIRRENYENRKIEKRTRPLKGHSEELSNPAVSNLIQFNSIQWCIVFSF